MTSTRASGSSGTKASAPARACSTSNRATAATCPRPRRTWSRRSEPSVTISFTYYSDSTRRREMLYRGNAQLRRMGLNPVPVGASPLRDGAKATLLRAYTGAQGGIQARAGPERTRQHRGLRADLSDVPYDRTGSANPPKPGHYRANTADVLLAEAVHQPQSQRIAHREHRRSSQQRHERRCGMCQRQAKPTRARLRQ